MAFGLALRSLSWPFEWGPVPSGRNNYKSEEKRIKLIRYEEGPDCRRGGAG